MAAAASVVVLCALVVLAAAGGASAWPVMSPSYYEASCPSVYDIVRRVVQEARCTDPRAPASLLRLHFHDCFVNVRTVCPRLRAMHGVCVTYLSWD